VGFLGSPVCQDARLSDGAVLTVSKAPTWAIRQGDARIEDWDENGAAKTNQRARVDNETAFIEEPPTQVGGQAGTAFGPRTWRPGF